MAQQGAVDQHGSVPGHLAGPKGEAFGKASVLAAAVAGCAGVRGLHEDWAARHGRRQQLVQFECPQPCAQEAAFLSRGAGERSAEDRRHRRWGARGHWR